MDRYAPRPFPHINSIIAEVEEGFNLIVWLRTSEVDSLLLADEPVPTLEEAHARTYRLGRERGIDPEDIEIRTKLVTEHADTQRAISDPGAPRFGRSGAAAVPRQLHTDVRCYVPSDACPKSGEEQKTYAQSELYRV